MRKMEEVIHFAVTKSVEEVFTLAQPTTLPYVERVNLLPAYSATEAARFLEIPKTTVRAWIRGQHYHIKSGERLFKRVIIPADEEGGYLSFINLIELMVLEELRKRFTIPLSTVRLAIQNARNYFKTEHPLADLKLLTDLRDVFVEQFGTYLDLSRPQQTVMKEILESCLLKIDNDASGIPRKLYPKGKSGVVEIDPLINFGRPSITGVGIATEVIFERHRSGETTDFLASDYRCDHNLIESAIEYEHASREKAA